MKERFNLLKDIEKKFMKLEEDILVSYIFPSTECLNKIFDIISLSEKEKIKYNEELLKDIYQTIKDDEVDKFDKFIEKKIIEYTDFFYESDYSNELELYEIFEQKIYSLREEKLKSVFYQLAFIDDVFLESLKLSKNQSLVKKSLTPKDVMLNAKVKGYRVYNFNGNYAILKNNFGETIVVPQDKNNLSLPLKSCLINVLGI